MKVLGQENSEKLLFGIEAQISLPKDRSEEVDFRCYSEGFQICAPSTIGD